MKFLVSIVILASMVLFSRGADAGLREKMVEVIVRSGTKVATFLIEKRGDLTVNIVAAELLNEAHSVINGFSSQKKDADAVVKTDCISRASENVVVCGGHTWRKSDPRPSLTSFSNLELIEKMTTQLNKERRLKPGAGDAFVNKPFADIVKTNQFEKVFGSPNIGDFGHYTLNDKKK